MYSAHNIFTCFKEFTRNIDYFSINIKLSVFITEAESIYCAVRTGSLNATDPVRL